MSESRVAAQQLTVTDGYGYGVAGADLHVFGDGTPLYLLQRWQPTPEPDPGWLMELPSRMLNARYAVVGFTGRVDEYADLLGWRDEPNRLSVRWLHGEGGAGKTRLADRLAAESAAAGWQVVSASHGPGTLLPQPGTHDLRLSEAAGLLLVVDYADRWPYQHLTLLLDNALLYQLGVRARVLLIGRSANGWPAVSQAVEDRSADGSVQELAPLPDTTDARARIFTAARNSFARRYGLADPSAVPAPESFHGRDLGLVLALGMAALVAVDAHVSGVRVPDDMAGLTVYLLDREHEHWATRHSADTSATTPQTMNRVVFTANLAGPRSREAGTALVTALHDLADPAAVITDHGACYPPDRDFPGRVLEPVYPDRLAEDFLALTLPGHTADFPSQRWAAGTTTRLLTDPAENATRAIVFLSAAASRWPHVGEQHLYPVLHENPGLAVEAGGAALSALAAIENVDLHTLAQVFTRLPPRRQIDLDVGAADIAARILPHLQDVVTTPPERIAMFSVLSARFTAAGRYPEALAVAEAGLRVSRESTDDDRGGLFDQLIQVHNLLGRLGRIDEALAVLDEATALAGRSAGDPDRQAVLLVNRGNTLSAQGRTAEAVAATRQAVQLFRQTTQTDDHLLEQQAVALSNLGNQLLADGRPRESVAPLEEAIRVRRRLVDQNAAEHLPELSYSVNHLANVLLELGQWPEGLAAAEEVVTIRRRLAEVNPAAFEDQLAGALNNLAMQLNHRQRHAEALPSAEESVGIYRRLAEETPLVHLADLAMAVGTLAETLRGLALRDRALAAAGESERIRRRLARLNPVAYLPDLASALRGTGGRLTDAGRVAESLAPLQEAVTILRRLVAEGGTTHELDLAAAQHDLAASLLNLERYEQALPLLEEAVTLRRRLADQRSLRVLEELAGTVSNLGVCLMRLGRSAGLLATQAEATDLFRALHAVDPQRHVVRLAGSLLNLGTARQQLGDSAGGRANLREAAALIIDGVGDVPPGKRLETAGVLARLGSSVAGNGDLDLARPVIDRSVAMSRLAGDPPQLAEALLSAAAVSWHTSRYTDALPAAQEAISLLRPLADDDPATYLPMLAQMLDLYASTLAELGRSLESLLPAQEATERLRTLAGTDPASYLAELARTLHNRSLRHFELGDDRTALDLIKQAVRERRAAARYQPPAYRLSIGTSLVGYAAVCVRLRTELPEAIAAVSEALTLYQGLLGTAPQQAGSAILAAVRTLADVHEAAGSHTEAARFRAMLQPDA